MAKVPYAFKVDEPVLEDIKNVAEKQHRSINNTIEVALIEYIEKHKFQTYNKDTKTKIK